MSDRTILWDVIEHLVKVDELKGENWTVFLSNAESGRSERFRNKELHRKLDFSLKSLDFQNAYLLI